MFYDHKQPVKVHGYGFGLHGAYQKGDPRAWRLEAKVDESWLTLHKVDEHIFQDRDDVYVVYLLENSTVAQSYRLVVDRFFGFSSHVVLEDFFLMAKADQPDCSPINKRSRVSH